MDLVGVIPNSRSCPGRVQKMGPIYPRTNPWSKDFNPFPQLLGFTVEAVFDASPVHWLELFGRVMFEGRDAYCYVEALPDPDGGGLPEGMLISGRVN